MVEVLFLVAFLALFGGIAWLVIRDRRIWREGLADLRSRRGWAIRENGRLNGRMARVLVAGPGAPEPAVEASWPIPDPDGRMEDWMAVGVVSSGNSKAGRKTAQGGRSRSGFLEWRAPAPRWESGILVLGPRLPDNIRAQADAFLERLDHPLARTLLARLFGDALMGNLPDLRYMPAPDGMTPPFSVFSTGNPGDRVRLGAVADILADTPSFGRDEMSDRPIIVLAPEGMRVRLNRSPGTPAEVERFIDLALRLQAEIAPGG